MKKDIYRVTRDDYKSFIEQIKPECREIKTINLNSRIITKIFSKSSKECLCSRITYNTNKKPEEYYIFTMPADNERLAPVPHMKIELQDAKEVQAFFDAYFKMKKEQEKQ